MKYKVNVTIVDPKTKQDEKTFDLECQFFYNSSDYGNGYHLSIAGKNFYEKYYDLRYNTEFDSSKKESFLIEWANNYWPGKNGAYKLKSIKIEKDE